MKLLILCFILCSLITFGQEKKQFIGGNINVGYEKNINNWQETIGDFFLFQIFDKHISIYLNPEFGISKSRRLEIGGNVLYGFEKFSNDTTNNFRPEELMEFGRAKARQYDQVTVLFADFKGFTKIGVQYEKIKSITKFDPNFQSFFGNLEKDKISLFLMPIVSYSITDALFINCTLGNISYARISKWIDDVSLDQSLKTTQIDLEFNFNAADLLIGIEFRL